MNISIKAMKLISFDVGIKNLAYCILEVTPENDYNYTIQDWGILNLVSKPIFNCGAKQKKKPFKLCGKNASYVDSEQKYYCKQHAKMETLLLPPKELSDTALKRAKLVGLKDLMNQFKVEYETPIKKQELIDRLKIFRRENCLQAIETEKVNTGIVSMSINLTHILDDLLKSHKIDCVLIENQISKIASTMKTIQGLITQYFVMIHVEDVQYISSYNKLKMFVDSKKNYSYKERKDLGIRCAGEKIKETQENSWVQLFNQHKKKDDLADAFLQALWFINVKMRTT
jgi:hypothetical protein